MRKTRILRIIAIIIAGILTLAVGLCFLALQVMPSYISLPFRYHEPTRFLTASYTRDPGGEAAAKFFPTAEELGDYADLDFYFVNNSLKSLGSYGNTFMLTVTYADDAAYDRVVTSLFDKYEVAKYYQNETTEYFSSRLPYCQSVRIDNQWSFFVTELLPGSLDDEQEYWLLLRDEDRTVRFLFLENGSPMTHTQRFATDMDSADWDGWVARTSGNETFYDAMNAKYISLLKIEK